jgi:membrane-bound inhibitor of C-type lysozyme
MLKTISYAAMVSVVVFIFGYAAFLLGKKNEPPIIVEDIPIITGQAMYQCSEGKKIEAEFGEVGPVPEVVPGQPPVSNNFVSLSLNGAPSVDLPQVVSADGGRYANPDESLVFWIKGNGAMVLENGEETNYKNCLVVKADSGNLSQVYLNKDSRYSLRYPAMYTLDTSYVYQNIDPEVLISGVKFMIPESFATGTNLSKDSYISVERRDGLSSCLASDFLLLRDSVELQVLSEGNFNYSYASSTDAGAGNRYEEHVYALVDQSPCLAVRYFIHYSAIENYDIGAVTEFNKNALLTEFDSIRQSMTIDAQMLPSPLLKADVYPLYSGLKWESETPAKFADLEGFSVTSESLANIMDISAVTMPFEKYYADLLQSKGWEEDITMSAGGPGAAVIAYNKDTDYIVLQYGSEFGVQNDNEPLECPCSVTFTVFSGSK